MSENRSVLKRRLPESLWFVVWFVLVVSLFCAITKQAWAAEQAFVATPVGEPVVVFDPKRDACDGHDVPDAPLRAWRSTEGAIHAFGLHYENRRLSGASLLHLKPECGVVFRGSGHADPAKYDDRSWITATWTQDGRTIHALVHHEFQANTHKGRCAYSEYMKCWWNSVLAVRSEDGGQTFTRSGPGVIAATPFPSEIEQGRHRGFFNPSNIIARDGFFYTLISTTGWGAQPGRADQRGGVCLFRSADPAKGDWRAYDGKGFGARFPDPYSSDRPAAQACKVIAPFPAPVGALVRHRPSGSYLAIFQASQGTPDGFGGTFPTSGFYLAASRDLINWRPPSLVLETKTLYDSPCGANALNSYPVLIDGKAETRNFEDIGDEAQLFYAQMRIEGCNHTSDRKLIARKIRISTYIRE